MANENLTVISIVAIIGALALILLFMSDATGRVSTNICPENTATVISGERFLDHLKYYQDTGHQCFLGYDGITPCCVRGGKEVAQYEYISERELYQPRARWPFRAP